MRFITIAAGVCVAAMLPSANAAMLNLAMDDETGLIDDDCSLQINAEPAISLDDIQIFISNTSSPNANTYASLAESLPNYRPEGGAEYGPRLDFPSANPVYAPPTVAAPPAYAYLFSKFGENYETNNRFRQESPATNHGTLVPEPATLVLMIMGLAGILYAKRTMRV